MENTVYIKVGQIINTFGHRGEVKVFPLTDDPKRFYKLKRVFIESSDGKKAYNILQAKLHKQFIIIKFEEIIDMNQAILLKNNYIVIPENEVEKLSEDSFYIYQIIGLQVYENENKIGEIIDVFQTGSNDVFVLKSNDGKEILIPALKKVIKLVDLENKLIKVELPLGLMD